VARPGRDPGLCLVMSSYTPTRRKAEGGSGSSTRNRWSAVVTTTGRVEMMASQAETWKSNVTVPCTLRVR